MASLLNKFLIAILINVISLSANTLEEAKVLYSSEEYAKAIPIIEKHLDKPEAQYLLGKAFLYGLGVPKDEKKAFELAKKSADNNFSNGTNMLGACYLDGIGVEKDGLMASSLFLKAANEKNSFAMYNLASMYLNGNFFTKDINKGINWIEKAIENNHPTAIVDLAGWYRDGIIIPKDIQKAIYWFKKGVEEGKPNAVVLLGSLYSSNDVRDDKTAKYYFELYLNKHFTEKDNVDSKMGPFYGLYGKTLERLGEYKKAFDSYKKGAYYNDTFSMVDLYFLTNKHKDLPMSEDEKNNWLKKAHEKGNPYASLELYSHYWESENFSQALEVAEYAYSNGNTGMGCFVSQIYSLQNHPLTNYKKAYEISSKIIKENPSGIDYFGTCALTLAQAYANGTGANINIQKAIEISIQSFDISKKKGDKNHVTAAYIGSLYQEKLKNSAEALKWYKTAYDISHKDKYLNIINKLKITEGPLKQTVKDAKEANNIFPILNLETNFYNIANSIETEKYIIIADAKKSIVVYDKKTFKVKSILRGYVGNGFDGIVKHLAFDEKNELLYSASLFYNSNIQLNNQINVFDVKKGTIVKTLKTKSIEKLIISKDGSYLLSLHSGNRLSVIDTKTNMEFDFTTESKTLIDGYIKHIDNDWLIYVQDDQHRIKVFSVIQGIQVDEIKMSNRVIFKENYIYLAVNGSIDIFSYEKKKLKTITLDNDNEFVRSTLSLDENYWMGTTEKYLYIYDLKKNLVIHKIENKNSILTIGSYVENNIIGIDKMMNIVFLNIIDKKTTNLFNTNEPSTISKINFENNFFNINYRDGNNRIFNFDTMEITSTENINTTNTNKAKKYQSISKNNGTTVSIEDIKTGQQLSEVCFFDQKIDKHEIISDKYLYVSLENIPMTFIFDLQGKPLAKIEGFISKQNILFSNSELLMIVGKDNVVNIYNLLELANLKMSDQLDEELVTFFENIYGSGLVNKFSGDEESLIDLVEYANKFNLSDYKLTVAHIKSWYQAIFTKKYSFFPLASFYLEPKSNEWIVFNPQGYFASSPNGESLIQYHLNQGFNKEAKIVDNKKLFSTFYRPDLIRKSLLEKAKIIQPELSLEKVLLDIKPPTLNIVSHSVKDEKNLNVKFSVCDEGSGISDVQLFINNLAVSVELNRGITQDSNQKASKEKCRYFANQLTLMPGKNELYIRAFDGKNSIYNTSKTIEVKANYTSKKPNLHIFTVAIDKYRDASLQLKYPVKDASVLNEELLRKTQTLFDKVMTYSLYDLKVNKKELLEKFISIAQSVDANDVFVLFMAGHGVTHSKNGKYYYLPSDFRFIDEDSIEKNGLSIDYFKDALGLIPANKSLILIDTCSSGTFVDSFTTRGIEEKMAINRLTKATGRNFIVASTKEQVALEGYKNHGVFTYSLLEALQDSKNYGSDNILTIGELALFVENRVPEISYQTFGYEQVPQKQLNGNDFPIAAIGE